jgi:hypothetical protein
LKTLRCFFFITQNDIVNFGISQLSICKKLYCQFVKIKCYILFIFLIRFSLLSPRSNLFFSIKNCTTHFPFISYFYFISIPPYILFLPSTFSLLLFSPPSVYIFSLLLFSILNLFRLCWTLWRNSGLTMEQYSRTTIEKDSTQNLKTLYSSAKDIIFI